MSTYPGLEILDQMHHALGNTARVVKMFEEQPPEVQAFVNDWALSPEVAGITFD